ncbi:MAG: ATP-dependent DNA helicase [Nitrososphaerota archaeon]|nr:ATP-dependent DNA helicase [Nitrososphaerota archaeon]
MSTRLELFYPYEKARPGQARLSEEIIGAVVRRKDVVIEAPSGFGKTAAALAASYHLVLEHGLSVVYVVRTRREMERVMREAVPFSQKLGVSAVPMLGMSDGCLLQEYEKTPVQQELLPFYCRTNVASGRCFFFEGVPRLHRMKGWWQDIDALLAFGRSFRACPYIFGRRSAADSRIIITTYAQVLNSELRQRLELERKGWSEWVAVFDEAHNMPEAALLAASNGISLSQLRRIHGLGMRSGSHAAAMASRLMGSIARLGLKDGMEITAPPASLMLSGQRIRDALLLLESMMRPLGTPFDPRKGEELLLVMRLYGFLEALLRASGSDLGLFVRARGDDVELTVSPLDPMDMVRPAGFRSRVYLSATISLVGFSHRDATTVVMNADPLDRKCLTLVDTHVSTAYSKRSEQMYRRIASGISNFLSVTGGRKAVFFPSYAVMTAVGGSLGELHRGRMMTETPRMRAAEQAGLLRAFVSESSSVLLGVMGGKFAEGEDFESGSVAAAVVVGLPLPPPTLELRTRLSFVSSRRGRAAAYEELVLGPAAARIVQAAGRVFRREGQEGTVLLMDERFGRVTRIFPRWLRARVTEVDTQDPEALRRAVRGAFGEVN